MLVAGFGIPGCGKSTLMRRMAREFDAPVYLEPEESEWPAAVRDRDRCGHATALQYFRSARVPLLFEARERADQGELVFLDSIYDKLFHLYMDHPDFAWLISPPDAYFENSRELARLDYEQLPNPDVVIFFQVAAEDWTRMVRDRGRSFDEEAKLGHYLGMQAAMFDALRTFEHDAKGTVRLITFQNVYSSVEDAATTLIDNLRSVVNL